MSGCPPPFGTLIGHRGAAAHAPENTLAGLARAAELGCAMVEVDVKLTADGAPILMHDATLDRTTDGTGPVRSRTLAEIRRLDAGAWFDPAFTGEQIPTLDETLDAALRLGLAINLEIKPCRGLAGETAEVMLAHLARRERRNPAILISSFTDAALAVSQAMAPELPRGLLIHRGETGWHHRVGAVAPASLHPAAADVTKAWMREATGMSLPILPYTVNEAARAAELLSWGAAAIITDDPNLRIGSRAGCGG